MTWGSTPSNFLLLMFPGYLGTFRCKNLTKWAISLFRDLLPSVQLQDELLQHLNRARREVNVLLKGCHHCLGRDSSPQELQAQKSRMGSGLSVFALCSSLGIKNLLAQHLGCMRQWNYKYGEEGICHCSLPSCYEL